MQNRIRLVVVGIVTACAAGCASSGSAWKATGYRQSVFGYEVSFRDAQAKAMTGPDWQLDNHHYDSNAGGWVEKTGDAYMAVRHQDWDQNGTISEGEQTKEPIFDLRLLNKKNNGVIWTKAHPLLPEDAEQDLEVVLDNYVDSLTGNGLYAQGNLFGIGKPKVRNFTTFLVSKQLVKVGSSDALAGTIEIAEVDRLKHDPQSRSGVVKVVLLKVRCFTAANCKLGSDEGSAPSTSEAGPGAGALTSTQAADLKRWPEVDCRGKPCRARTGLLVVGYYNTPGYFDAGLPELDDLLKRVSFPDALALAVTPPAAIAEKAAKPTPAEPRPAAADAPPGGTDAPPAAAGPPAQ